MDIQDWFEKIEQEFENQTSDEFTYLVNKCSYEFPDDEMIVGIVRQIRKTNKISFNQWKALKAHLSKHNNPTKRFYNGNK